MSKWALAAPKKRTDSKKGPFFGRFGRKTGVPRIKKALIFCHFSLFQGFFGL
jgi:hypothetical protein